MSIDKKTGSKITVANNIGKLFARQAEIDMPEKKLLLAVLLQAVYDAIVPGGLIKHQAITYFKFDGHYWICDTIGLCPIWVKEIMRDHAGIE